MAYRVGVVFVSSSDFRQLALKGEAGKSERQFRAAISAFCSLPRPTRREIVQLEDLALPLFDKVSVEGKRFAAAALSECENAPRALLQRLCNETVDIAAPLLIRSRLLKDIDLIALIGRHGLPHARAIARRPNLNPVIRDLVAALENAKLAQASAAEGAAAQKQPSASGSLTADHTRERLRAMMLPSASGATPELREADMRSPYERLRDTALIGNSAPFHIALGDATAIGFSAARSIVNAADHSRLLAALHSLGLSEERAFLIVSALFPGSFADRDSIRRFLAGYRKLRQSDTATERGRQEASATSPEPANAREILQLKAS